MQNIFLDGETGVANFSGAVNTTGRFKSTASDFQFGAQSGVNQPWFTRALPGGGYVAAHLNGAGDALVFDTSRNAIFSSDVTTGDLQIVSAVGVDNSLTLHRGATDVLTIDGVFDGANINASQVLRLGTGGSNDFIIDAAHNATFSGDVTAGDVLSSGVIKTAQNSVALLPSAIGNDGAQAFDNINGVPVYAWGGVWKKFSDNLAA